MGELQTFLVAIFLVSLRLVPTLAFSPPFTLMRIPALVRLMLALMLSAWIVVGHPAQTTGVDLASQGYLIAVLSELMIGIAIALPLQLVFAGLQTAGRAIDLQAGFAFAMIADPTSRAQMPLIGTIFAYAAAVIFFTTSGPTDLLAIWSLSFDKLPLGSALSADSLPALLAYLSAIFLMALAAGGLLLLVLFLIDISITLMSRTLPQMNVLVLGFQVKTLATLVVLPFALVASTALLLRMIRFALATTLDLL